MVTSTSAKTKVLTGGADTTTAPSASKWIVPSLVYRMVAFVLYPADGFVHFSHVKTFPSSVQTQAFWVVQSPVGST